MHRWTVLVLTHRRVVVLAWLLLAVVGGALAPALVVLLGDINWHLPAPLARLLRTDAGPAAPTSPKEQHA